MAFVRVWKFRVAARSLEAFEQAYGPSGDWARLFGAAEGFLGTSLLRSGDAPDYLTIDRWSAREDWDRFLAAHGDAYRALDRDCERLTVSEEEIGGFEEL